MKNRKQIETIFEDDDILVVSKPAYLLTIPDRYDRSAENLKDILQKKYPDIFVVHRLDKDTSGVMLFARNAESHKHFNKEFEEQKVKKIYHVITAGSIPLDKINIDIPIMPNPSRKGTMIPSARGKESLTIVNVVRRFRHATLVECELVTGRQHQIRVHLATIGYPLLVDYVYSSNDKFYLSLIKKRYNISKNANEEPIISRLTMHSYELQIRHPASNKTMSFTSEYPRDFKAALQVLNKYSSL